MERYRRTTRHGAPPQEKMPQKERMLKQSIVCIVITIFVALAKMTDTTPTKQMIEHIRSTLCYTVDYEGTVHRIVSAINDFSRGTSNETHHITPSD